MKKWVKYIISTIIFFILYTLMEYLFARSIDWKMTIISTIMYAALYTICDIFFTKRLER